MNVKVIDSSLLAAIVFGEPELSEAEALLGDAQLVAPSLLRYELANIAWKKAKKHPGKAKVVAAELHAALGLDIKFVEVDHDEVLDVALEKDLTVYDAAYLWLARSLNVPLATLDRKLRAAR